ncbi:MAG TPA: DUF4333 domain-containing protein [Trichocoleus sp.]|jgi:hypothetical protein
MLLHPSVTLHTAKRHFSFALLLFSCSTVALTGCSVNFSLGGSTLDTAKVEGMIKEMIPSQLGVEVQSVSCPKDVEIAAGATFQCQVKTEKNDTFAVDVKQEDDQGNVHAETPVGLLSLAKVEQSIQQGVEQKLNQKVTADCGGALKVVPSGETFECQVTDAQGETHTAKVTATSNDGDIRWEI